MESEDVVDVKVGIEGETHVIEFDHLPVECPIISVKMVVHKGNKVVFKNKGGYVLNITPGKKLHLVEKHGMYDIKIQVHPRGEMFHWTGRLAQ